jgi:hypothetical protein
MATASVSPPRQAALLQWRTVYGMLELQCDIPIVEALTWAHQWAYLEYAPQFTILVTTHDYTRNLHLLGYHNLIVNHQDECKIIARYDPTTHTTRALTE